MSEEQMAVSLKLWEILFKHLFIWVKKVSCRKITRKTGLRESSWVLELGLLLLWILPHPQDMLVPLISA